jgi:hypothetical protein
MQVPGLKKIRMLLQLQGRLMPVGISLPSVRITYAEVDKVMDHPMSGAAF